jgi:hypothetical protein
MVAQVAAAPERSSAPDVLQEKCCNFENGDGEHPLRKLGDDFVARGRHLVEIGTRWRTEANSNSHLLI